MSDRGMGDVWRTALCLPVDLFSLWLAFCPPTRHASRGRLGNLFYCWQPCKCSVGACKLGKPYTVILDAKDAETQRGFSFKFKKELSMDNSLHVDKQMDEAKPRLGAQSEDSLLAALTEAVRGLGGRGGRWCSGEGGMLRPAEDERRERSEREQEVLGVLRELSVFHSHRMNAWREALREPVSVLHQPPPGGAGQQHPSATDIAGCKDHLWSDSFIDTFLSVGEDVENITSKLSAITTKLDAAILQLPVDEASAVSAALEESRDTSATPGDITSHPDGPDRLESGSGHGQKVEDGGDERRSGLSPDTGSSSYNCDSVEELQVKGQVSDFQGKPIHCQSDLLEETEERINGEGKEEARRGWVTVGLAGQLEDSTSDVPDACFIRVPVGSAEVLRCEVADALSCLMVSGSEELVSRVIRVKVQAGGTLRFPVTVVVPFRARYRGSYRDVAMKVVDEERRASYITPVTTEGVYGGQRGSFAEVKVYSLGLFAVISCLKRENYTVPRRGLSLKLPMDPRICLNYLPGSFTAPVMAQTMIQPVDAVLLAAVRSRSDAYHSVVSTSPLLYLTHPTSQPLRRPLTVTLPCPPNPEQKRGTRGQTENQDHQTRPVAASLPWDLPASSRLRLLGASVKSNEMSNESLVALGSKDKQWSVLDKVTVRNQQNGLVSLDLTENFDRLLVVRLLSPLQPGHLTSLTEELEESICCHAVTVVLQRRQEEPHVVLVAALPSRDLGWELTRLQAQGYGGVAETSSEISMCEADQLLLRFSGNITSSVCAQNNKEQRLTFHSQRDNHLSLHLTEVDPFGNYSSPHYKGTAVFYKVTRGQLEWRGDEAALKDADLLGEPVCKLPLTLPKKVRKINRPITTRVKLCEETDSLSDSLLLWLSGELSEEETSLLVPSLRLRRSAAQLVKLRAGDSPSSRAFHVLATWRRGLPAVPHQPKASQLAHCLAKSGRPDLARELLLRQAAATRQSSVK